LGKEQDTAAVADAPPLAPDQVIDLAHLARMTLGEPRLEAEVLALFDRQAAVLLERMRGSAPQAAAAFAHTLKGSAAGIGAWRVAAAAAAVEQTVRGAAVDTADVMTRLAAAVAEARIAIAHQLEPHDNEN
jgi:HPt (histidine-containing phosphotransfer) domain-containing protein